MYIFTHLPWHMNLGLWGTIWYVLVVIGLWMTFEKAHEAGWKALIPFYNLYVLFKICDMGSLFFIWLICTAIAALMYAIGHLIFITYPIGWILEAVAFILLVMMWFNLSKAYGHGLGYALGLTFFTPIFVILLGFGSSRYYRYF